MQAIRTLRLLECHHQKLAEVLKVRPVDGYPSSSLTSGNLSLDSSTSPHTTSEVSKIGKIQESHAAAHTLPLLQPSHRELSSSIASNLASARGIPSGKQRRGNKSPAQLSPQNIEGRVIIPQRRSRLGEQETTTFHRPEKDEIAQAQKQTLLLSQVHVQDTGLDSNPNRSLSTIQSPEADDSAHDDTFSRFYTTFGNLISTLSAPLAFAGLPLSSDPLPSLSVKNTSAEPSSPISLRAPADPDLTRIFSRAALHAVRDGNGALGGAESFYVVPTTGGTMSYASMVSHTRHGSHFTEDDEAEFVDASETPHYVASGPQKRYPSNSGPTRGRTGKTIEELEIENESLRAVTVDFADRLRVFELGAQRSSIALHASIRAISSPTESISHGSIPPVPNQASMTKALEERIRAMEDETKSIKKENKRLARENQKFISVIERYRERWEMLKVGARERVK